MVLFLRGVRDSTIGGLLLLVPTFCKVALNVLFFLVCFTYGCRFRHEQRRFNICLVLKVHEDGLFNVLLTRSYLVDVLTVFVNLPMTIILSRVIDLIATGLMNVKVVNRRFSLS